MMTSVYEEYDDDDVPAYETTQCANAVVTNRVGSSGRMACVEQHLDQQTYTLADDCVIGFGQTCAWMCWLACVPTRAFSRWQSPQFGYAQPSTRRVISEHNRGGNHLLNAPAQASSRSRTATPRYRSAAAAGSTGSGAFRRSRAAAAAAPMTTVDLSDQSESGNDSDEDARLSPPAQAHNMLTYDSDESIGHEHPRSGTREMYAMVSPHGSASGGGESDDDSGDSSEVADDDDDEEFDEQGRRVYHVGDVKIAGTARSLNGYRREQIVSGKPAAVAAARARDVAENEDDDESSEEEIDKPSKALVYRKLCTCTFEIGQIIKQENTRLNKLKRRPNAAKKSRSKNESKQLLINDEADDDDADVDAVVRLDPLTRQTEVVKWYTELHKEANHIQSYIANDVSKVDDEVCGFVDNCEYYISPQNALLDYKRSKTNDLPRVPRCMPKT